MPNSKSPRLRILKKTRPLRVGFLPVNDCAPLAVACELGLFEKYDVAVELRREASWKNVNDQIIHRQLDAAHAPATLPFLINLNLTGENCVCLSGLVLSLQGNAITISHELWKRGVRDAKSLRPPCPGVARTRQSSPTTTSKMPEPKRPSTDSG